MNTVPVASPADLFTPETEGAFLIPPVDYFAAPGVSNSMLKNMQPTPAHLPAYLAEKREPTPEMILGTLTHALILNPDEPLPRIAIKPREMKFSTTEGKLWKAQAEADGRLIVPAADYDAMHGMMTSVSRHPFAREALGVQGSMTEVSLFGRVGGDGKVLRKARLDIVPSGNCLGDVKTTVDASPGHFAKQMVDLGYACQAAYYLDLWNWLFPEDPRTEFVFWAVEKAPPYLCACYYVGEETLAWARAENERRLAIYSECAASGVWPGYPETPQRIDVPRWALGRAL